MARNNGRHRISRRTKIASASIGLAMAVGALVVVTTAGDPGSARADAADPSFFVDITKVKANVKQVAEQNDASTGTFTVACGVNENGHFNPDNFIAQPGIKNGAQHLHDYVGNLSTNADSTNQSLVKSGTTCKNGDQSAYFWPVIRIDTADDAAAGQGQNAGNAQQQNQQQQQQNGRNRNNAGQQNQQQQQNQDNAAQQDQQNQDNAGQQDNAAGQQNAQDRPKRFAQPRGDQNADDQNVRRDNRQRGQNDNGQQNQQGQQNQDQNAGQQDQDQQAGNQSQAAEPPAELPGVNDKNEVAGNDGEIQRAASAEITFRGSPTGDVVAMPKFLRILYGDAKVSVNGEKNARDSWTCAGFENKVLINKYPVCPNGAAVKRIHDFPSCWDGKNTDSTNHRDHIVFPDANGQCQNGFKAVPQLRITLTYNIPQDIQQKGQYKVDSFPEEEHNPFTDHDDFANVMSTGLMNRVVDCINQGKTCSE
jgi:hypothetical protein